MQHGKTEVDLFRQPAEMFSTKRPSGWTPFPMQYRRFDTLALAVKFAVEEMAGSRATVVIRTEKAEFKGHAIQKLYDDHAFPLARGEGGDALGLPIEREAS